MAGTGGQAIGRGRRRRVRAGRRLRRILVGLALAAALLLTPHWLGAGGAGEPADAVRSAPAARAASAPTGGDTWVVRRGDTLWEIARAVAPDADPREVIAAIMRANGLRDARLRPGMELRLPGSGE